MVVWLLGSALTRININPGDGERMDKTRTAAVRIMKRVICLGSYQGSDAVAWRLADILQATPDVSFEFETVRCASPAQLVSLCAGAVVLAIIDASLDLEPGSARRLSEDELAGRLSYSSHGVDLLTALGLARALGDLPAQVAIVGIGVDAREPDLLVTRCLPTVLTELRAR
jgi:hydrogenase maturation protease